MTTEQKQNRFDTLEEIRVTTLTQINNLQLMLDSETDTVSKSKIEDLIDYHWNVIKDVKIQKVNL